MKLNKEIYEQEKVNETLKAFGQLADIRFEIGERYYECFFSDCKYDEIRTIREFENYLIAASNK